MDKSEFNGSFNLPMTISNTTLFMFVLPTYFIKYWVYGFIQMPRIWNYTNADPTFSYLTPRDCHVTCMFTISHVVTCLTISRYQQCCIPCHTIPAFSLICTRSLNSLVYCSI